MPARSEVPARTNHGRIAIPDPNDDALIAYLEGFVTPHKLALFDRLLAERTRWVTVVLEDVYQAYNASACMRSCDAFGVQDVHVVEDRARFKPDGEIPLGASQWLTLHRHGETSECLATLRERGYLIVATTPDPTARSLHDCDVSQPIALLFGSEKPGLSGKAIDGADDLVRIPMYGFAESFNISVSLALCLQHFVTQLRRTEVDWPLTAAERDVLRRTWVRAAIGPAKLPAYERRFAEERAGGTSQS